MLQRILVPISGTEYSWRALEYASQLARLSGGSLVVMTVAKTEMSTPIFAEEEDMVTQIGDEVLTAARALMQGTAVECTYLLRWDGGIAEKILEAAQTEGCDAIVMGSNGFGVFDGLLKSGVSQTVISDATLPVIVRY